MDTDSLFKCDNGSFHACQSGSLFWGCCLLDDDSEVCGSGCPEGELEPTWFKTVNLDRVDTSSLSCDTEQNLAVKECLHNDTVSFLGCYWEDYNDENCPDIEIVDVGNATLSAMTAFSTTFPTATIPTYSPSTPTTFPYPSTSSSYPFPPIQTNSATGSTTAYPTSSSNDQGASTGAITGEAVGSLAAIAILTGALVFYCRRRRSHARKMDRGSREKVLNAEEVDGSSDEKNVIECKLLPHSTVEKTHC